MKTKLNFATLLALVATLLCILVATAGAAVKSYPPLAKLPTGDRWYLILLNDEATGFLHLQTTETPEGYRITGDSSIKITVMGFTREAAIRETYEVNRDLTLRSLHVDQTIDKSSMTVDGAPAREGWKVTVTSSSGKKEKLLKGKGAVYPPAAVNLYPLLKGFTPGKKYTVQILDAEEVKLKKVDVQAVGVERENGAEAFHLSNDLYPFISNEVWVDGTGATLRESVRDGLVTTRLEKPEKVHAFISEAAVARKDLIYDFSLIKVSPPLAKPTEKKRLVVEFDNYPSDTPLPAGPGQQATRSGGLVTVTVDRESSAATAATAEELTANLAPSPRIPSDHPEIVALSGKVVGEEKNARRKVELLVEWVAKNIAGSVTDSHSPLETLKTGNGNCQAHSRLYGALARAAGIPTRFVSGLVYTEGQGFMYHSWNESIIDGAWVSLDATFGQIPSDATHIRIAIGETPEEMAPLAPLIGRLKAKIVSATP